MKISKQELKQIIKEELGKVLKEQAPGAEPDAKTNLRVKDANTALGYIESSINSVKDIGKKADYTFKFINANKELDHLRKNPTYKLTDKFAKWAFKKVVIIRNKDLELYNYFLKIGKRIKIH
tara:strand:+ start:948 stop:1313 length:366 start_codon:yes stop_codon:yes gene_type:complete